jgi:hypothetical protein
MARRRALFAIGCVVVALVVAVTLTVRFVVAPLVTHVREIDGGGLRKVLIYASSTVTIVANMKGIDAA